jgi:hypothetical protein
MPRASALLERRKRFSSRLEGGSESCPANLASMSEVEKLIERAYSGLDERISRLLEPNVPLSDTTLLEWRGGVVKVTPPNSGEPIELSMHTDPTDTFLREIVIGQELWDEFEQHVRFIHDDTSDQRGVLVFTSERGLEPNVMVIEWSNYQSSDGARELAEAVYSVVEHLTS